MTEERFKVINGPTGTTLFDDLNKIMIDVDRPNWIMLSQLLNNFNNERNYFLETIERIKNLMEMREYEEALSLIYDLQWNLQWGIKND